MKPDKLFRYLYFTVCCFFLFMTDVRAYVDPSVLTYAIQAIAGIAIALGTAVGIYGRRIRKVILGKEEEANRDIAGDDLVFHDPESGDTLRALSFLSGEEISSIRKSQEKKKKTFSLRSGILITLAVSFLWMLYSPLMLYLGNMREFLYDIYSILPAVGIMFAFGMAVGSLVYFIAHKAGPAVYTFFTALGLAFLIISFIHGNFMAGGLPPMDGTSFDWSKYGVQKLQSYVLILVVGVLVVLMAVRMKRRVFFLAANNIAVFLTLIMAATLFNVAYQKNGFTPRASASVTTKNLFVMSENKNVIFFMIDATDSGIFRDLMESEDPEYREYFEDFTYFPNTVGSYTYTSHAVPFILTGEWFENQEDFEVFETRAMNRSKLLASLEEEGYLLGMYEDQLTYADRGIYRFDNVMDDHYVLDSIGEYARQSFYMTWFQYMPYPLKPLFSHEDMFENIQHRAIGQQEPFIGKNIWFNNTQKQTEFSFVDQPCFRFIHLEGAHVPFHFDKDVNEISTQDGSYSQNVQASITIVHNYLSKLKEAGIFDNSAIIVLADHGYRDEDEINALTGRSNPLLLIKGFGEKHAMETSEIPISQIDFQEMYQKLLAGNSSDQLFDLTEGQARKRRFLAFNFNTPELIWEFETEGYAGDFDAMHETGNEFVPD
ncbi:MAG: sulfatase-like hydrolase/transferase [Solobacterium sp.]|nr:sulfatase-like hydrolase/transferase [Solobacterium sp.]